MPFPHGGLSEFKIRPVKMPPASRRRQVRDDRGDDLRTDAGVEREIAPLLDQRLRQRFGEQALGQAEGERLAPALVAAFIARRERHLTIPPTMPSDP